MSIDRARPPAVDAAAGGAWHAPARLARRCAPADDAIRSAGAARGRARRRRAPGPRQAVGDGPQLDADTLAVWEWPEPIGYAPPSVVGLSGLLIPNPNPAGPGVASRVEPGAYRARVRASRRPHRRRARGRGVPAGTRLPRDRTGHRRRADVVALVPPAGTGGTAGTGSASSTTHRGPVGLGAALRGRADNRPPSDRGRHSMTRPDRSTPARPCGAARMSNARPSVRGEHAETVGVIAYGAQQRNGESRS